MLPRWNSVLHNIKAFVRSLNKLIPPRFRRNKRGRKPKHSIKSYFKLIIAKEYKNSSLREAEQDYSKAICNTRVDYSVIHYWERKFDKSQEGFAFRFASFPKNFFFVTFLKSENGNEDNSIASD